MEIIVLFIIGLGFNVCPLWLIWCRGRLSILRPIPIVSRLKRKKLKPPNLQNYNSTHSVRHFTPSNQKYPQSIPISHHNGDSTRLFYSVQSPLNINLNWLFDSCAGPWTSPIIFDQHRLKSYGPFDGIETSKLDDHMESLILLGATLSLLKQLPSPTLYTINLVHQKAISTPLRNSKSLFSCDPVTMFTLLRYALIEYLTGIYHCCGRELALPSTLDGCGGSFAGLKSMEVFVEKCNVKWWACNF